MDSLDANPIRRSGSIDCSATGNPTASRRSGCQNQSLSFPSEQHQPFPPRWRCRVGSAIGRSRSLLAAPDRGTPRGSYCRSERFRNHEGREEHEGFWAAIATAMTSQPKGTMQADRIWKRRRNQRWAADRTAPKHQCVTSGTSAITWAEWVGRRHRRDR